MFYSITYCIGIVLLAFYVMYLTCITYKALNVIRFLKKTYRYAIGSTIFVMSISSALMLANGQASQRLDPPLFMSIYVLFNVYIWFIAYLYAPHLNPNSTSGKYDIQEAERERNNIMKEFYEAELQEPKDDLDQTFDTSTERKPLKEQTESMIATSPGSRRDMKKNPEQKVKEKLWESIVNQADQEAQDDSSSDELEQV